MLTFYSIFFILFSKIFPKNGVNCSSCKGFILLNNSINKFKSQISFRIQYYNN